MPTTYTDSLRLAKPGQGEQTNTWGVTANTDYNLIDQAVAGYAEVDMSSDANVTLTELDGASDESRNMYIKMTSAVNLTQTRDVIVPTASKLYFVENATDGSQSIRVKTAAGTGITITTGKSRVVFCDGTNVIDAFNQISGLVIGVDVQAYDALLQSVSGLTFTTDNYIYGTGSNTAASGTITTFGRSLVDDATAGDARTTLGLGTMATQAAGSVAITGGTAILTSATITTATISGGSVTGITDITVADGGTGASTEANARTNLDVQRLGVVEINNQTTSYTLVLTDRGKLVEMNSGSATVVTVPTNASVAYPTGTSITIMRQGAGTVTITPDVGVTVRSDTSYTKIASQYAGATLVKRDTNEWYLFGKLGA